MKRKLPLIVFFIAFTAFCFITPGLLIGLDNLSPYWGYAPIQNLTRITKDYFNVGPLQFLWWLYLLSFLKAPVAIIAKGWIPLYLALGLFGYLHNWELFTKKKPTQSTQIALIIASLTSLVILWLVSAPSLIYLGLFAISPYLLCYLLVDKYKPPHTEIIFTVILLIPILLSTSVNLVALSFTILSALIISLAIYHQKTILLIQRLVLLGVVILSALQLGLFTFNIRSFVITHAYDHLVNIQQHPFTEQVSAASVRVEKETTSFSNALRFSLGWQNIVFPNKESVFPFSWIRTNPIYVAISVLWVILIFILAITLKKNSLHNRLAVLWVVNTLILSTLGIYIIQLIPILRDILRMGSTKLWLLTFFPYIVLTTSIIQHIFDQKGFIEKIGLLISASAVIIPVLMSGIFPKSLQIDVPQDYLQLNKFLKSQESLYIFPVPQMLYFRQYDWGYYGADFLGFMLKTPTIYDETSLGFDYKKYKTFEAQLKHCAPKNTLETSYLLIDKTVTESTNSSTTCNAELGKVLETTHYTLYRTK